MEKAILRRPVENQEPTSSIPSLLWRIYGARGIESVDDLERGLHSLLPFKTLSGIEQAVDCLEKALRQQRHIMIIGDFDADGATSTAVAVRALRSFGAREVAYLVPNRFEFGYGLTPEIVAVAAEQKPDLIITVDNGISNHAGVAAAKALGITVIITDHHLAPATLPEADAIVNPNKAHDPFPSKHLAGVGVIFYVMLALRSRLRAVNWFAEKNIPEPNLAELLDLVALGTVADVVTLDKNNRILVYQGLQRIRAGKTCVGIKALLEVAGRPLSQLTASDLGFAAAPRLNAAGRLEDMTLGIACLLSDDENKAREMAVKLDTLNRERQAIEGDMRKQAQEILLRLQQQRNLPVGLCLYDENWHQGVVGLIAGRIKEQFHRPVIVFAKANEKELKGSARSIAGLHIRDILADMAMHHPALIKKFGGHAMAAGLTLLKEQFDEFTHLFNDTVSRQLQPEQLQGKIYTDGELTAEALSIETAELVRNAGPWGQGFPEPLFDGTFRLVDQRLVGQHHLKMILTADNINFIDAIAFNVDLKKWPNPRCENIRAAYRLDVNEFRGRRSVQLIIEHLETL